MADGGLIEFRGKTRRVADLFCGAGGVSTGVKRAMAELGQPCQLIAVNHWPIAIATHTANHPEARHHCADLESARPIELVPEGALDLLCAAPSCVFHSRARGGKPVHDQQRMDPWHVVRWCTELRVKRILVENVPEFQDWGPCSLVTGRPLPSRKGEYFRAWCEALRQIGFRIDWKVLCSADYGDPTTRQRFFLIGRSDRGPLRWPVPSHSKSGLADLLGDRPRWRAAAEIIDWSIPGRSIFGRKKPLKPNTIRRILAGAQRYGWPQPYLDALQALLDGREPALDVAAADAEPLMLHLRGTSQDALARSARGVGVPLPALTAGGTHVGLVMATGAGGVARDLAQPIPTVTAGGDGGARPHLLVPLVINRCTSEWGRTARPIDEPFPTIATAGGGFLAQPLVAPYYGGGSGLTAKPTTEPLPTLPTKDRFGLIEPVIVSTSNSSSACVPRPASDPLLTITTSKGGHLAVVSPVVERYRVDILYRMLHWRELSRAMSFEIPGEDYHFTGSATDITKQIGNAVSGMLAKALARALMEDA